jgi:hypothetical protein
VSDGSRSRALVTHALISVLTCDPETANAAAERAAGAGQDLGDASVAVAAQGALGAAIGRVHGADAGIAVLDQALVEALAAGLGAQAAWLCVNQDDLAEIAGDPSHEERYIRQGLALDGVPVSLRCLLQASLGHVPAHQGKLDGALAGALASVRQAAGTSPGREARVAVAAAYVHGWRGEPWAARRLLEAHGAEAIRAGDRRLPEVWGLLLEAERAPAEALAHYRDGAEREPMAAGCLVGMARIAATTGTWFWPGRRPDVSSNSSAPALRPRGCSTRRGRGWPSGPSTRCAPRLGCERPR